MSFGRIGTAMIESYKGRAAFVLLASAFQYLTPLMVQNLLVLSTPIEDKAGQ